MLGRALKQTSRFRLEQRRFNRIELEAGTLVKKPRLNALIEAQGIHHEFKGRSSAATVNSS